MTEQAVERARHEMEAPLARLRQAADGEGVAPAAERRRRLQQVIDMLVESHEPLVQAMDEDFGGRPAELSLANDILGSLSSLKHARDHCDAWMQPQPRQPFAPYDQLGAEAWVQYQPKGVVGIIGTWNAPLYTLLSPLACVLGAGNRAILKPSELAPRTAAVLVEAFARHVDPDLVQLVTGGPEVGAAFAGLPLDHLVFTGSTEVGRKVMEAASRNLVSVTLELGGKSPAVVGSSADLATAAWRLALAKSTNAGQLCISPDLVHVPRERLEEFLTAFQEAYASFYPRVVENPQAVAVINDHHLARIESLVEEARETGARVETVPDEEAVAGSRRRPLSLVVAPPQACRILREEIFGPALVVLPYDTLDEVIEGINAGDRPLALYHFGEDTDERRRLLEQTLSGGVTLDDALMHAAMHDAPFGGVGASGMGRYHGWEGFQEFSHPRTVFKAPAQDPRAEWGMLPPYGGHLREMLLAQVTSE
ncbi:coniferyl aldehyde dehydrogenase [Halomonas sp. HK25]|uniref:coniferyl aldehyde dehydrogenase n=1 Tax=Halomonas sp. HK25 TaxID=3394321 RepID=UPI0039FC1E96